MDALTIHADFLRRMARALLHSSSEAEDLVQDTFVVALQKEPREKAAMRPWLLGILRNQMRNRFRGAKRRGVREQAAAREEALPPTDELVAKEDIRRRVVDTLMGLDEPLRTTLILRFYEELPPREVAKRMDCPVETVRTRTRRGLEKMRRLLDEQHEGNRTTWMAALTPWAFPAAKAAGLAAVGGATGWKLGAAAVLLVGIALGARHVLREAPVEEQTFARADSHVPAADVQDATADGDQPLPPQLEGHGSRPSAITTEAQAPGSSLIPEGHAVLTARLKGIEQLPPGARVEVRGMRVTRNASGKHPTTYTQPVSAAVTSKALRIDVEALIAAKPPQALWIQVFAKDYEDHSRIVYLVPHSDDGETLWFQSEPPTPAEARQRIAVLDLELELRSLLEGTVVAGRVTTPDDEPVHEAWIEYRGERASESSARESGLLQTDNQGRFRLRLQRGQQLDLMVRHNGYLNAYRVFAATHDETTDLGTIVLDPGASISGRVVGADLEGHTLRVHAWSGDWLELAPGGGGRQMAGSLIEGNVGTPRSVLAQVDPDGRFTVTGLGPGRTYRLQLLGRVGGSPPDKSPELQARAGAGAYVEFDLHGLVGSGLNLRIETSDGGPPGPVALLVYKADPDAAGSAREQYDARDKAPEGVGPPFEPDAAGNVYVRDFPAGSYLIRLVPLVVAQGEVRTGPYESTTLLVDVPDAGGWVEQTVVLRRSGQLRLTPETTKTGPLRLRVRVRHQADSAWHAPHFMQGSIKHRFGPGRIPLPIQADCVEGLAPGDYDLEWQDGDGPVNRESFTIHVGKTTTVELDLDR